MPDNSQKTPLARSLNQFAERKVRGIIELLGKSLPASVVSVSGSIVTVKFEISGPYTLPNVTVPLAGPEYARPPTQKGDKGVVFSSDAYLGGMSGLGGGVADLSLRANLSSLVFFPIGNKGWTAPDDPNAYVIYGPDGVILRDTQSKTVFTLTAAGVVIQLQAGDALTVNGKLIVNGDIDGAANFNLTGNAAITGSVSAASAAITNALTAGTATIAGLMMSGTAIITGAMSAGTAAIAGTFSAASAAITGAVTAASATLTGVLTAASGAFAAGVAAASAAIVGLVTAADVTATGTVTGGTDVISGSNPATHVVLKDHVHVIVVPAPGTYNSQPPTPGT